MASPFHSIGPNTFDQKKAPTYLERLANALVYILAFPFIAIFIGMKRIFTAQKGPAHSYYNSLPEQHLLGQQNAGAGTGAETPVGTRTRSRKT